MITTRLSIIRRLKTALRCLTLLLIVHNLNGQEPLSNVERTNSIDFVDSANATNVLYNFNELALNSIWSSIDYPYASFYTYNSQLVIGNYVSAPNNTYPNYITCNYPYGFGRPGVHFNQVVHNLSFSVVGGNGGNYKADIYRNNQYSQTLTLPASCGNYTACFVDLRTYTSVTGVDFHDINDVNGIGFDDFSFTLGASPTPTPAPTPTPNQAPIGSLDGITNNEGKAYGWSKDPDNVNTANLVHFYIDGTASNNYVGAMVANKYRADVGNHAFEFDIPDTFRDNQQHTLRAYGIDLNNIGPNPLLPSPKTFTLPPRVESVVFESIVNETISGELTSSEVLTDTTLRGRSQRIFPDAKQPDENINRKRIRVKATLSRPIQGVQVYFRNFDVDDPSSDSYIDENGATGNDNREGRIIGQPYPTSAAGTFDTGSPCTATAVGVKCATNSSGEAVAYFTVTKQPGDNFVVAASIDDSYLTGLSIDGTGLKDSSGDPLPTTKGKRTDLLTVWRTLHMEVDSMGNVSNNSVICYFGGKGTYVGDSQPTVIEIYCPKILEEHAYKQTLAADGTRLSYGGRVVIAGGQTLQILDNLSDYPQYPDLGVTKQTLRVQSLSGSVYLRPKHPLQLFDDDDFNSSDSDNKDGDEGENVEELADTLSYMQASDNINFNSYAAAYIKPDYQWARDKGFNNLNVPFVLYSPCTIPNCEEQRLTINQNRESQIYERDNFWIGYLLVSYQGSDILDVDSTGFLGGVAPYKTNATRENVDFYDPNSGVPPGGIGATIYIESIRDYSLKPIDAIIFSGIITLANTKIAPHEVGHQFGLAHFNQQPDGGIMSYTGDLRFNPFHINLMRWRVKSPGEGE